ncbi:MAG: 50S ribosomal protein L24 [Acholeplasmatales bacterium]|jgi:large subunit ribosomal protein L24|nr:50S ribosomal protein L24 [Acholeplasmataceae bacterium]MDY0115393.1 50S ribosomal protein L24 [Acholeplasmatales bacterium]MCK9234425.1 50S ribosomal protein L24 [Acholeplasmataceae bacterium]MCK9288867.1 50S ribosomal protein L24 [Acholeplasmataceae bacterium]MCK9427227.1 50S ribosomal protein L24 [Acholeplasmataceae bacterium]
MNIKVGDTVAVIAGKDRFTKDKKGNKVRTTGVVIKSFPKENRVVVKGVNIVKKHERSTQEDSKGQILEVEAPIHVSNVMILDPKQKVPTRIGYKVVEGKKVRYAKVSGEILDK